MSKKDYRLKLGERITGIMLIVLFLMPTFTFADGMSFWYRPASSLEPLEVDEQRAVIAHKNGIQRMFIAINLGDRSAAKDASRNAVWIFPVPGTPTQADVSVTDFFPELKGKDVERNFLTSMEGALLTTLVTQPHFMPFRLILGRAGAFGMMWGRSHGVTTHKTVDRWGIHAELITVDSVESLADYLRKKKVQVVSKQLSPFAEYLSDKYTLVVAWIRSHEELMMKFPQRITKPGTTWPSLYVEFPAKRPFYPMRPTSGYGKKAVKVSLYLVGWLSPDMSSWSAAEKDAMSPRINYYAGEKQVLDRDYRAFLSAQDKDGETASGSNSRDSNRIMVKRFFASVPKGETPFTKVVIQSPAETFVHDLVFQPNPWIHILSFIAFTSWMRMPVIVLFIAIFSYVSGGISGKLVFGKWTPWAGIGLWNFLTVPALVAAIWWARKDSEPDGKKAPVSGRWEAFVFGALVGLPILVLFGTFPPKVCPTLFQTILQGLGCILSAMLLLIAAWIVSKPGGASLSAESEFNTAIKEALVPIGIRETFIRVVLMCFPALVISMGLFIVPWFFSALDGSKPSLSTLLTIGIRKSLEGVLIYSISISSGLFLVLWVFRKVKSAWSTKRGTDPEKEIDPLSNWKPEERILLLIACLVAALVVLSVPDLRQSLGFLRIIFLGLIATLLFTATWLVRRGTAESLSLKSRFAPGWPIWVCLALVLLGLSGFIVYGLGVMWSSGTLWIFPIATMVLGFFHRKRIGSFVRYLTYMKALSIIFIALAVLSYFAIVARVGSAFIPWVIPSVTVRDALAIFALISATWIVKGELQEKPTKALRFGLLFSCVFTVLNLAAFYGVQSLFAPI